ncbi:MAG: thiamine pyrophosphate-binding protein [Burkholderiales bacterium]|nr:thiamine pyrophosphate-binding protein [Burkholderiales bacterium]
MLIRDEALRCIAAHYAGEIVVPVYTSAFEWLALRPDALNYLAVGAMGQASSHALGLALGCPDRRVLVFDGDGSLLMNLGSLVTIGAAAPRNLVHFVFQNGTYEANGGMPLPARGTLDFASIARVAGYAHCHTFDMLANLDLCLDDILAQDGPIFVDLRVTPGTTRYPQDYDRLHSAKARDEFRAALLGASADALPQDSDAGAQ